MSSATEEKLFGNRARRIDAIIFFSSAFSFSPSCFFFENGKTSIPVRALMNTSPKSKADGNLGFLTLNESLTSEHDVLMLLYVCVDMLLKNEREKEDAFKSRTSLKSCRRPTEKKENFSRKCNGRLREIQSPLSLPFDFFLWKLTTTFK